MRKIYLFFLLSPLFTYAQDVVGDWSGSFIPNGIDTQISLFLHIVNTNSTLSGSIRFTWPDGKCIRYETDDIVVNKLQPDLVSIKAKKNYDSTDLAEQSPIVCSEIELKNMKIVNNLNGITMNLDWKNEHGDNSKEGDYLDPKFCKQAAVLFWRQQTRVEAKLAYIEAHCIAWKKGQNYDGADDKRKAVLEYTLDSIVIPTFIRDFYNQTLDPAKDKIEKTDDGLCTLQLEDLPSFYLKLDNSNAKCLTENYLSDRSGKTFIATRDPTTKNFSVSSISVTIDCGKGKKTYILTVDKSKLTK